MGIKSNIKSRLREWHNKKDQIIDQFQGFALISKHNKDWEKTFDAIDD